MEQSVVRRGLRGALAVVVLAVAAMASPNPEASAQNTFESEDFVVTFAKAGDSPESLAQKFLGDRAKAWMIEDYNGAGKFSLGQEVIIPKRSWNPSGVEPSGYQIVPILVYHNISPAPKGRVDVSVKSFEEQMRYLKAQEYRVTSMKEFFEFISLKRQLPSKTVLLTFDDAWKSFYQYAYPILKELGFNATLFVYTDFVGARSALSWDEIREVARQGFDIEAHSKTHNDLRRKPGESDANYTARMKTELELPRTLFQRNVGNTPQILAYPYGGYDDELLKKVKEYGYVAAFDVKRQGNPSFISPLKANRSQIYGEMKLEDFVKNLNIFNQEAIR